MGLPQQVISNQGPQVVAELTSELYHMLRIWLATTAVYHLQGDGQTECVSQELEQYLWLFVNERQDDWDEHLLLIEFQYIHVDSKNTDWHPQTGFEPDQPDSQMESMNEVWDQMETSLSEAQLALIKDKDDMAQYYN